MFVDISDNIDLIVVVDHVVGCVPDPYVLFYDLLCDDENDLPVAVVVDHVVGCVPDPYDEYDLPVAVADDHAVEYDLFALYTNYRK